MEEGYSFAWPANGVPYMNSPGNQKILLEVEGNIPYIVNSSTIDEQTESESISRLIAGHLDVSYQPEIIDREVDPQGFNCDFEDHSYIPQDKVKRKRGEKIPKPKLTLQMGTLLQVTFVHRKTKITLSHI